MVKCPTTSSSSINDDRWQSIWLKNVFVWLLIGRWLAGANRYQLTNLIDWISDDRLSSIYTPESWTHDWDGKLLNNSTAHIQVANVNSFTPSPKSFWSLHHPSTLAMGFKYIKKFYWHSFGWLFWLWLAGRQIWQICGPPGSTQGLAPKCWGKTDSGFLVAGHQHVSTILGLRKGVWFFLGNVGNEVEFCYMTLEALTHWLPCALQTYMVPTFLVGWGMLSVLPRIPNRTFSCFMWYPTLKITSWFGYSCRRQLFSEVYLVTNADKYVQQPVHFDALASQTCAQGLFEYSYYGVPLQKASIIIIDRYKHYERWATACDFPVENIVNDGTTTFDGRFVGSVTVCHHSWSIGPSDNILWIPPLKLFC